MTCSVGTASATGIIIPIGYRARLPAQLSATPTPTCTTQRYDFEHNHLDREACLVQTCGGKTTGYLPNWMPIAANYNRRCATAVCDFSRDPDKTACTVEKATCGSVTAGTGTGTRRLTAGTTAGTAGSSSSSSS